MKEGLLVESFRSILVSRGLYVYNLFVIYVQDEREVFELPDNEKEEILLRKGLRFKFHVKLLIRSQRKTNNITAQQ